MQTLISCTPQIVESPNILAHGIDTLELNLRMTVPPAMIEKMERAKKLVQTSTEDCESVQFGSTELFTWAIKRHGVKHYPYILQTGDLTLYLSAREADSPLVPARIHIGSISCNNGVDHIVETLKRWLKHYGVESIEDQLSRVDCYVDVETSIRATGIDNQDRHVTRANHVGVFTEYRKLTGVQVGKSEIVLRVYDKLQEMASKGSTEKQIFFTQLWGKNPENVTRVEYQIRREAIKELIPGRTDWESVKPSLPGVWCYLVTWFKHTAESVAELRENNNQHLAETSWFWKAVESSQTLWRDTFGKIVKIVRTKAQRFLNLGPLLDQAAGCMVAVAAALGTKPELFAILATVDKLKDHLATKWENAEYDVRFKAKCQQAQLTFEFAPAGA